MTKRGVFWMAGALGIAGVATFARPGAAGAAADGDSMQVELGRRLFFDPAVGRRGRVGCAECHQPENGFSDPRARSQDEDRELPRHSQPVTDVAGEGFHWDGEFPTVRDLIDSRVLPFAQAQTVAAARTSARVEAATKAGHPPKTGDVAPPPRIGGYAGGTEIDFVSALAKATPVAARLAQDGRYDEGFRLAYGDATITPQRVGEAIDAYVRSLRTSENGLDRFVKGDSSALSESAQRGLGLFRGKAGCAQCHVLDARDGRVALTDGKFHDTGVAFRVENLAKKKKQSRNERFVSMTTQGPDEGRAGATFLPADTGSFKTPSLRDVARRAPYMHDGSFATLAEVVDYYDKGGTPNEHLDARIRPLSLSATDRDDLVTFLESLTGSERAGLGGVPEYRKETLRVRIEDLGGNPVKGLAVRVVPCGDRLRGTETMPLAFEVRTDDRGDAIVSFPKSTQVRLESDGYELGLSRPIPDWVASTTLLATPKTAISVRVRKSAALKELPAWFEVQRSEFTIQDGNLAAASDWKLTRIRTLSADEAVYTLNAEPAARRAVVSLVLAGVENPLGAYEIDLAGGASETIDLGAAESLSPDLVQIEGGGSVRVIRRMVASPK